MNTARKLSQLFVSLCCVSLVTGCTPPKAAPLQTVSHVDLQRYLGKWYEIARFPNWFQKQCGKSTAEYTPNEDLQITVTNRCMLKDGSIDMADGIAKIEDTESNAKLKVSFLPSWLRWTGIGWGRYWIIDLETDYQYAVVSEPSRKYLWILSRTPEMDQSTYQAILNRLKTWDFDVSRLILLGGLQK